MLRDSGSGRVSVGDITVAFSPDFSFCLSFFLFLLDVLFVSSSCTAAGVGDCWDFFRLTRLRFFSGGRSPSADTPPLLPSFSSCRVFSAARLAASCSINLSTFVAADWTLSTFLLGRAFALFGCDAGDEVHWEWTSLGRRRGPWWEHYYESVMKR